MEFNKNKDEIKNQEILKKEISKTKGPFSKILIDSLFNSPDSDECRKMIKDKISEFIDLKIKK